MTNNEDRLNTENSCVKLVQNTFIYRCHQIIETINLISHSKTRTEVCGCARASVCVWMWKCVQKDTRTSSTHHWTFQNTHQINGLYSDCLCSTFYIWDTGLINLKAINFNYSVFHQHFNIILGQFYPHSSIIYLRAMLHLRPHILLYKRLLKKNIHVYVNFKTFRSTHGTVYSLNICGLMMVGTVPGSWDLKRDLS